MVNSDELRIGGNLFEPPFLVQTLPQIGAGQGLQDIYHNHRQVTVFDNLTNPGIGPGFFAIEADDKTGNHRLSHWL